MSKTSESQTPPSHKLHVKYEDMTARYANHVLLNVSSEECYLDFSSGVIPDHAGGSSILPVHTRIVMTHAGARRLYQLLGQALQNQRTAPLSQEAALPGTGGV